MKIQPGRLGRAVTATAAWPRVAGRVGTASPRAEPELAQPVEACHHANLGRKARGQESMSGVCLTSSFDRAAMTPCPGGTILGFIVIYEIRGRRSVAARQQRTAATPAPWVPRRLRTG